LRFSRRVTVWVLAAGLSLLGFLTVRAEDTPPLSARPQVKIPRLEQPPRLEDFLSMQPATAAASSTTPANFS